MDRLTHDPKSKPANIVMRASNLPRLTDIQRTLCEKATRHFMRHAWPMVEPAVMIPGFHIDAICDHLDAVSHGHIKKLIINIPPRHCKSLTVSVFWPAQIWTWRPETRFIYGSHDQQLATRDNLKTRRLISSPWYKENWGDKVVLQPDQSNKQNFELTATGQRRAVSVGAGITGDGGDILVCDDPHNVLQALASPTMRQEAINWWTNTMSSRLNPGTSIGARVVIMQRVHEEDLTGYLLDHDPDYEVLCLPAWYEKKHPVPCKTSLKFEDPREKDGDVLWEAGMPNTRLRSLANDLGTYAASGQLQQRPSPEGGGLVQTRWFRLLQKDEWPKEFDEVSMFWDLSVDEDPEANETAGWVMGRVGVRVYGIALVHGIMGFNKQVAAMKALHIIHPEARGIFIEKAGHANALYETLEGEVPGMILVPPFSSGRTGNAKLAKVLAWSIYAEAGNLFLPAWEPWREDFLKQMEAFPNGKYDDIIDAYGTGVLKFINRGSVLIDATDLSVSKDSVWRE